mmetsp:Transcript_21843/g.37729  ORF Transcript_21843/g.37729 Transcript_21843/m.37729 type:complete len:256 (+) Transcript_21843:277-1044(+)
MLLLAQVLDFHLRSIDGALVRHASHVLIHGLPHIVGGAEQADPRRLVLVRPHRRKGHVADDPRYGAFEQLAVFIHQVDVEPREIGLIDALGQRVDTEVELVVAQRRSVQLEPIQNVDHLRALEKVAEHGGREQVAGEDDEGPVRVPPALLVDDVRRTRHPAPADTLLQHAGNLVDVVEVDDRDFVGCRHAARHGDVTRRLLALHAEAVRPVVLAARGGAQVAEAQQLAPLAIRVQDAVAIAIPVRELVRGTLAGL